MRNSFCLSLNSVFFLFEESGAAESCDDFTDLDLSHCFIGTTLYVRLLLYTRSNLDCGRELNHHRLSSQPLFNLSRPTTFVIHGYRPTGAPPIWIDHIVHLLAEQEDMNVIVVDWNRGAANLNYFTAVANTRQAAYNLTSFIMTMQEEGASLSSVHLIGVSLGAHLAGFVGANLKGRIGRITAFGLRGAHGHIDYYANGGADQPGCPKTIFAGKSYFVCDHQRSVFLFLCALNRTCSLTGYPCTSYSDFLDGRCLQCEAFKPAPCPVLGDGLKRSRGVWMLRLVSRVLTAAASCPAEPSYRVDMVTWNQYLRWGVVYIRLHSGRNYTELIRLEQYTSTRLLAQFDEDLQPVQKISMRISTGNVIGPRYKIRLLRIRLTPLERPDRPLMCRYDIIMEENMEVAFRPLPCSARL
uniref:Lipase, member Ib n=1 Tax=Myripristis murdjan TaxID=586833 RepID=A0A667YVK0_9TELE